MREKQKIRISEWKKHFIRCLTVFTAVLLLSGCISRQEEAEKIRDIPFTVMNKEKIPKELKEKIEEKTQPFMLTYSDQGKSYIARGYGAQSKSGYSVEVTKLYETDNAVLIHTKLLGPEKGEKTKEVTTYPYVVVELEEIEKEVLFN